MSRWATILTGGVVLGAALVGALAPKASGKRAPVAGYTTPVSAAPGTANSQTEPAAAADAKAAATPRALTTPIFDVPRLDDIAVDGTPDDWSDRGFKVNVLANAGGRVQPKEDFDASLRLAWNDQGLLARVNVTDDIPFELSNPNEGGDAVHLLLSNNAGEVVHVVIGPGVDPQQPNLRTRVWASGPPNGHRSANPTVRAARTKTDQGFILEALIPWSDLGITPAEGLEVGFQAQVNDDDANGQGAQLVWYPSVHSLRDPSKMYRLRLTEGESSPAVDVAAFGDYPRFHRTRIEVIAGALLTGKTVEICRPLKEDETPDDRVALKVSTLEPDFVRGDLASVNLSLPMPRNGDGYGALDVYVDGKAVGIVDLPAPGDMAKWALPYQEFVFQPCVFSTRAFPEGDFEDPSYVEDLIGPYEAKVTFYDAQYNRVVTADKPGRYGAIVEVHGESGKTLKRYCTLFREPQDVSWRNVEMPFTVGLPKEFGISAQALKLQSQSVSEYFKGLLGNEGLHHDVGAAVLMAGLYETKGTDRALLRNSPAAMDRKWWAGLKQKLNEPVLPHLTYLPEGYDKDKARHWPVVLFLHGKGERGDCLDVVREAGLCQQIEYDANFRKTFPAIVVAPQCPQNGWWSSQELAALLDQVESDYRVDRDREYVTGMSMGGYGTWALADEYPDRFAAIAPVCGGGDPAEADRLATMPVWTFHGQQDTVVPFWESERMVKALRDLGDRDVKFTVYPEAGHDAWTDTYANPELYKWLLSHKRSDRLAVPKRPTLAATPAATQPTAGVR